MAELKEVEYIEYNKADANKGVWGQLKRVALAQNGEEVGVHDADNTNLWEDGSEVDWAEYESNGWNCMVRIPRVWYKVEEGEYKGFNKVRRWEVSGKETVGFKLHPAFKRPNHESNVQYMSAFEGWVDGSGRLRSLPNKTVTVSKTIAAFRSDALKNGAVGYTQQDFFLTSLIQLLIITEYGTLNTQGVLGNGGENKPTGQSLTNGNHSTDADTVDYMSYRGIENFYSNKYKWVDGVNVMDRKWNVTGDFSKYSSTSSSPTGYEFYATAPSSDGNIRNVHLLDGDKDFSFIPSQTGGSSNADGFCDYYYQNTGHRVVQFGYNSTGAYAGTFCWYAVNEPSYSRSSIGARLQFLGHL